MMEIKEIVVDSHKKSSVVLFR